MSKRFEELASQSGLRTGRMDSGYQAAYGHMASVAALVVVTTFALVVPASAQEFSGVLQNIVDMLTGETARLLAILGVIVIGFLWIFGYMDLRRAAIVVAGIVVLFSAEEIVSMITG